ncbi:MAG: hypothetical protein K2X66_14095, partial [Cyanobacteria bacterium]|nr:hypothetical protein [Cyanobacteriota bacterium]
YPIWLPLGNSLPLLPTQQLKPNQPALPDKPLSPSAKLEQGLQTLSKLLERAKSGSALDFRAFEDAYSDLLKTESEIFNSDAYKSLSPDDKKKFRSLGDLLREDVLRPFKRWQRLQSDLQAPPPTQKGDLQKYVKDREYYLKEEEQVKDSLKEIIRLKGQTPEKILEADLKKLEADFEKTAAKELKPLQADLDNAKKDYQTAMDEEYQFAQALQKKKEKYAQVEGYIQKPLRELEEEYQARLKRFRADEAANRGRIHYPWALIDKEHKEQLKKVEAEYRLKLDPEHSALKEEIERDEVSFNKIKVKKAQKGLIIDEKTLALEKKKDLLTLPIQERQLAYQEELLAQEKQKLIRQGTMTPAGKYTGNGDDYLAFVEYGKKSMNLTTERKRLDNTKRGNYQVPSGLAGLETRVIKAQGDVRYQNDQIAKIQGQQKGRYDNFSPLPELPEG